jgi:uncharacterized oxidoreductase
MKTSGNTVLITGGATGIGFALAESFVKAGNEVIICGRREDKLKEAKKALPGIHIRRCDVSKEFERKALYDWVSANFKDVNILVNNAGIQRFIDFKKGAEALVITDEDEIEINLRAPISLSAYFIPTLSQQKESAIINISSGLGFVPLALFPVYCATKAALHSYTQSLRHQLKDTPIKVFEVIPPIVDTELGGPGKPRNPNITRIKPNEVAEATIGAIEKDEYELAVGQANDLRANSRKNPEEAFKNMNNR